ncbi:hypothetical protein [Sphingomonas sp.]|uniref:hypothetical protein n=1 Tax=Sphingomonas sp. TaxID=28214 RepID=UPI002B8AF2F2|nr:hypothetical protein [Sphingomonas sp.]HWK34766.1 hypothetical protein [Sphingomonas sp.]
MIQTLGLIAAAGVGLAGCTDGYGYSGVSVGYGAAPYGGYYDDYYGGYYGAGYGGYGSPYWGWYGDYYYPGTGYYVYDRDRRPHRWNDGQRNYWEGRRQAWRGDRGNGRPNWDGWRGNGGRGNAIAPGQRRTWQQPQGNRTLSPAQREQWQQRREAYRSGQGQQAQPRGPGPNRPSIGTGSRREGAGGRGGGRRR